jgi:hypothetical protein
LVAELAKSGPYGDAFWRELLHPRADEYAEPLIDQGLVPSNARNAIQTGTRMSSGAWYIRRSDGFSHALVIFPHDCHDIFGFGRLGEGAESAELAEQRRHIPPVVPQKQFGRIRGSNSLRHLRRQKSVQTADPLDLRELLGHPLFEQSVPARELFCLLF